MNITDLHKELATDAELEYIEALEKHGTQRAAAASLGKSRSALWSAMENLKRRVAKRGYSPEHNLTNPVPDGFMLERATLQYRDGEVANKWIKLKIDGERQWEIMQEAVRNLCADVEPVEPKSAPGNEESDIIPWFQIGDAHLGMLAYEEEVGHNFDTDIAERELKAAMAMLIDMTPKTQRCVIQDLGDFTHYENEQGTTEASGHALDCDTRYNRMIRVYARIMRFIVDYALERYDAVDVIINQGNHSRKNDHWMAMTLDILYENEPRLTVLNNSSVFIPYRMGNTFVMSHHSDKCKPARLAEVMATDFPEDWGESTYRYIDIGHIHHKMQAKEHPGVIIESWNQLAPSDKFAHDGGWRSRSMLTAVFRSKTYGEVGRVTLPVEAVKDSINNAPIGTEAKKRRPVHTV